MFNSVPQTLYRDKTLKVLSMKLRQFYINMGIASEVLYFTQVTYLALFFIHC